MVTRGRETQDMGNTGLTLLPPPKRRIPRRTPSNGERGWALWRPQGTRRQDRRPPGRHRGAWAAMADRGIKEALAGPPPRPRPQPPPRPLWLEPYYPQKMSLGKVGARSGTWGRSGSARTWGHSGSTDT